MLTQFIRCFKATQTDPDTVTIDSDESLANADRDGILYDKNFLYVAQKYAFNHIFFLMKTISTANAKVKAEYWDGTQWREAFDILDGSKGLTKSGLLQFSLDPLYQWCEIADTSQDSGVPEELEPLHITDSFWLRLSYNTAPTAAEIKTLSYAFTNTAKINAIDLEAPSYYESIAAASGENGKADWQLEILTACEMMVAEMKEANIIKAHGQIILLDDFFLPAAYRSLAHIYFNMGKAYDEKRRSVMSYYKSFLAGTKTIDKDMNGRAEKAEDSASFSRLIR